MRYYDLFVEIFEDICCKLFIFLCTIMERGHVLSCVNPHSNYFKYGPRRDRPYRGKVMRYVIKRRSYYFQNSNSKYSKGSYERDRMRERESPNGNSYRSESPECDSPRDRSGYHKSMYMSKSRDYKREKYSGMTCSTV